MIGVTDGHQSGAKSGDAFEEAPHPNSARESDDPLDDTGAAELVKYIEPTLQDTFSDQPLGGSFR